MKYLFLNVILALLSGLVANGVAAGQPTPSHVKPRLLDKVIIMAYSGPPLDQVSLQRYREVANANIEYLVPGNGTFDLQQNLAALDLAQKVGIKIIPIDMRLLPFALKPNIDIDETVLRRIVKDYKRHPALGGYVVRDEPNADMFPTLRVICDLLRAEDPAHEPLINLFPNYGTLHQFGVADYRTYIHSFIKTVKPGLLAYDSYPLRLGGVTIYDKWYENLDIVRNATRTAGIPFLVFIQSEGIKEGLRVPNRAEILWQVGTVLAYGAQGIGWFCYWTPCPDQGFPQAKGAKPPIVETHHDAMIDAKGNRTALYDYVRTANLYFKKVGNGLLGWDCTHVARYESGKVVGHGASPLAVPDGADVHVVIGTFQKAEKNRLVIANARCDQPSRFLLHLSPGCEVRGVFASVDAEPSGQHGSLRQWRLQPGGSVVLDLKRQ